METQQFRVLHREFLFRVVDRELLSTYAQGDVSKLVLQLVSLLVFLGLLFSVPAVFFNSTLPPGAALVVTLSHLNLLIATTMLAVGLFAILSWTSMFPDRRDVLVLAPLPVRPRTLLLAKVTAVATALSLAIPSIHALPGLVWPLRLHSILATDSAFSVAGVTASPGRGVIALPGVFLAYWITMLAAGIFMFCLVAGLQGAANNLLPRRYALRASSYLQIATFAAIVAGYFLLPTAVTPATIAAAQSGSLALPPSYWFLGLFQQLSETPRIVPLAPYAWWALAVTIGWTVAAYGLSYSRMILRIAEEADIAPGSRGASWWPRCGTPRQTAIVHFSIRTLLRSSQHRVILAFYWGLGFASAVLLLKTPLGQSLRGSGGAEPAAWRALSVPLATTSFIMLLVSVLGARVACALPRDLRANWIFQMMPIDGGREQIGARRRSLFALSVAPILALAGVVFLSAWPPMLALGHLFVLLLVGVILVELVLNGTDTIPFTCSYLPGKSSVQLVFWAFAVGVFPVTARLARIEQRALEEPALYAMGVVALVVFWLLARVVTQMRAAPPGERMRFDEEPSDLLTSLNVWDSRRDRVLPADRLRQGYGGPPKLYAKVEAGSHANDSR